MITEIRKEIVNKMYYYFMESRDIRENLAAEQYLMNNKDFSEPLVLFYIQNPCIIIGRNQNPLEEINQKFLEDNHITLTRRLSGGGAVYDDLGNVSFSFVVNKGDKNFGDFKSFTAPILKALHEMGAKDAQVSGRNDLMIHGKKFSGNAMYTKKGKTFSHGTLMFDVDLSVLPQALTVAKDKIESKGTKSVRSHVTNIKPFLGEKYQKYTTEDFRDELARHLLGVNDLKEAEGKKVVLTKEDQTAIQQLVQEIYGNPQWIYGETPEFTIQKRKRLPQVGIIDARLKVVHGKIAGIKFYGDYFGAKDSEELAEKMLGLTYGKEALEKFLKTQDISQYFTHLTGEELADLLWN